MTSIVSLAVVGARNQEARAVGVVTGRQGVLGRKGAGRTQWVALAAEGRKDKEVDSSNRCVQ